MSIPTTVGGGGGNMLCNNPAMTTADRRDELVKTINWYCYATHNGRDHQQGFEVHRHTPQSLPARRFQEIHFCVGGLTFNAKVWCQITLAWRKYLVASFLHSHIYSIAALPGLTFVLDSASSAWEPVPHMLAVEGVYSASC